MRWRPEVRDGCDNVWREGCRRFAVSPGMLTGRPVEVVFAISLEPRRPQVRVGLYDSSAAIRALPAIPRQRQAELPPAAAPEDSVVL